jgi:UDP-glucose 4-epimerase
MGLIGSHTVSYALGKGAEVAVLDNESTGFTKIKGAKYYRGSVVEASDVANAFNDFKPDVVIHLAAQPSLQASIEKPVKDAQVNILGTINMASRANMCGAKFIFSSTSAVYAPIDEPIGIYIEESITGPTSPYGMSKLAAEYYVRHFCPNHVIFRYGNVFGPRQVPLGENQFIPRAISYLMDLSPDFHINGSGNQARDFVYVSDIARANYIATQKGQGTFNAGRGSSISINDMYLVIQDAIGVHKEPPHSKPIEGELFRVALDSDRAFRELNWSANTEIYDAIKDTIEWWMIDTRKKCKTCPQ